MYLRPKQSLRLSICSIRRCIGFSNSRDFHLTHCAFLRNVSAGRKKATEVRDYESRPSVGGKFSVSISPKNVNDNFFGIESDEGVIEINSKSSLNIKATKPLFKNVEQEKLVTTTFGTLRYDSENKPKHHGQLEKEKVLISSYVDKDKIRNFNKLLLKKNSVENCSELKGNEKSSNTTTDSLDRNLKSKLSSSNYVDELYFPEAYTEKEINSISKLKRSPSSSNDDKFNLIEESYFSEKMTSETIFKNANVTSGNICSTDKNDHDHVESTANIADHKLSSSQPSAGLENSLSSSIDNKFNLIEECYFRDTIIDESVLKNASTTSKNVSNVDKNLPLLVREKPTEYIVDDKQSNFFDDHYFNTVSDRNPDIDKNNLKCVEKTVDALEEKYNEENPTLPLEIDKNKVSENLFISKSEVCSTDSEVTSMDAKFRSINDQETLINAKTLFNLNKSIEEIDEVKKSEQLSLEFNDLSLEEVGEYNKFIPTATDMPKIRNKFLFQNNEFLKNNELINSKSSSRVKKLGSFQKNMDETDIAKKIKNEEEMVNCSPETQNSKIKKGANVKNTDGQPETAYDFVKQLRSTKKKLDPELINGKFIPKTEKQDSKGYRILKNQVPDLKFYTKDEILELLVKNVIYSDDDVIVLNKPYNLVMHESKTVKDPCLSQYLDDLAAELDKKTYKPKLITVHRLDKETSGCLLLARNEISAQRLLSFFSQRKIVKTYWIVTTNVPDPLEGVIDMPISEGSINGRARMVLHPDLPKDVPYQNHSKSGKRAVTNYKVIAESGNAALVEATPETGIKHQIRVHFGFGLSCPILGDHKYSHLDKLAPQKLQSDLLQRLHVRQSKVRHIPMHIYARSIFIPQYRDGRNLFVMAPMPIHMSINLQRLKFKKK